MIVVVALVFGCEPARPKPNAPSFNVGDIVKIKLDGSKAMVTRVFYRGDHYYESYRGWWVNCRISALQQKTRDGIVSADTQIVSYSVIEFRPYELQEEEGE